MRRGDICLVEFGKSKNSFEFGKNRPVLIMQTDKLNFAVNEDIYDYFLVIPLSTKDDIVTQEFRYEIKSRDSLEKDSFIVCNSICFLHKRYLKSKLASISDKELKEVGNIVKEVLEID